MGVVDSGMAESSGYCPTSSRCELNISNTNDLCGSELARESVLSVNITFA
jgi:hypothetical protein